MSPQLQQQLDKARQELAHLDARLAEPGVTADLARYREMARRQAELRELVDLYERYQRAGEQLRTTQEMLRQGDLDEATEKVARAEVEDLRREIQGLESDLRRKLVPRDPQQERNAIVEIRAGTGGEEAALFAADLYRMYTRFAERRGWRLQVLSSNPTGLGGQKEVIFAVEGKGAYGVLSFESGVHRVQRVPVTEAGGRLHTSAATVAVLPEAQEVEVKIDQKDLRIDTFRAGGPGGQHMQKNETGVRITHLPSGIVVQCSDERSQLQNKEKAMRWLRARLLEQEKAQQEKQIAAARRAQVKTGDRSEKIRTYNFPQNRVTDHRIGLTLHQLDMIMEGRLGQIIDALTTYFQAEKLKQQVEAAGSPDDGGNRTPARTTAT